MSTMKIDAAAFDDLQQAMQAYQGNTEEAINEVLHNEASPLIQDSVRKLIPVSGRNWKGKLPPAGVGKSLTDAKENLAITVKSSKNYQYLYFPDDGSSTTRHAGNQQFFYKGGELVQDEIIDRCTARLVSDFEKTM